MVLVIFVDSHLVAIVWRSKRARHTTNYITHALNQMSSILSRQNDDRIASKLKQQHIFYNRHLFLTLANACVYGRACMSVFAWMRVCLCVFNSRWLVALATATRQTCPLYSTRDGRGRDICLPSWASVATTGCNSGARAPEHAPYSSVRVQPLRGTVGDRVAPPLNALSDGIHLIYHPDRYRAHYHSSACASCLFVRMQSVGTWLAYWLPAIIF